MTVGPGPASGSAQVKEGLQTPPEPATLRAGRRADRLGPIHVAQLLLAEATLVTILALLGRSVVVVVLAALLGVLLVGVTLARVEGRWLVERWLLRVRQRRRAVTRSVAGPDARLDALRLLAPDLDVTDVDTTEGVRVGVARDDAGWFAVAVVSAPGSMAGDARPPLPLETMVTVLSEAEQPGAVLQVVVHTVPAPGLVDLSNPVPASQSYRELVAQFGQQAVPMDQTTWVAVRLDKQTLAELGAEADASMERAPAVVAALIRRVAKSLRRAGLSATVLDANGLVAALARSCDLDEVVPGTPGPREEWSAWYSPRFAHRVFWVRGWPPVSNAGPLLHWLTTVPAALSSVAVVLVPGGDDREVSFHCLLRVAAPVGELARISRGVQEGGRRAGADLFPLDGEHGPAVYASAPTGGGPR